MVRRLNSRVIALVSVYAAHYVGDYAPQLIVVQTKDQFFDVLMLIQKERQGGGGGSCSSLR